MHVKAAVPRVGEVRSWKITVLSDRTMRGSLSSGVQVALPTVHEVGAGQSTDLTMVAPVLSVVMTRLSSTLS